MEQDISKLIDIVKDLMATNKKLSNDLSSVTGQLNQQKNENTILKGNVCSLQRELDRANEAFEALTKVESL